MRCPTTLTLYACILLTAANTQRMTLRSRNPRVSTLHEICRENLHYICQNEDCVPVANARCDGVIQCPDGSDEINCPTSGCILPGQPTGGSFRLNSCNGSLCNVETGSIVPSGSFLTYKCNEGYTLVGNIISHCHINAWYLPPTCARNCPVLKSESVNVACRYHGESVSCRSKIVPGTKALLECKESYKIPLGDDPGYRELTCLDEGVWDRTVFHCIPECGRPVAQGHTMIVNGFPARYGSFPWHVGIYQRNSIEYFDQICAGTLVSPDLVISAAHCFWDDSSSTVKNSTKFAVAAGKCYRPYNIALVDPYAQKSQVKKIDVPERYFDVSGNYAHDIALLRLETPFVLTTLIRPICMDWDNRHEMDHLRSGEHGKAVGWGRTAITDYSIVLQEVNLPYIPYQNCIASVPEEFRGFVTPDKFCAGYLNGSSLCDGDSGGGLFFQFNGLWFLRGIVSVAPVSNGTCNENHYTAFTNVGKFLGWIRTAYFTAREPPEEDVTSIDHTTTVTTIGRLSTAISASGCILPEEPTDGSFELGSCTGPCNVAPRTRVPIGSFLVYQCNDGYTVNGNNVTICYDNAWYLPPTCVRKRSGGNCPPLKSQSVDFECKYQGEIVSCESAIAPWTKATLVCKNFYKIAFIDDPGYREITCLGNGLWNHPAFDCIPECGTPVADETEVIVNGSIVRHGRFPWRVEIYVRHSNEYFTSVCMGTLVSPRLVIASAWWFDDTPVDKVINASKYAVAVGKYYSPYNWSEPYAQKSLVKRIDIARGYDGFTGHYAHNIALLCLETTLAMTILVRPICVDWNNSFEREQFQSENSDQAVKRDDTVAAVSTNESRRINLPYVPYEECLLRVVERHKRYVMANKFCVECSNGSRRCNSDGHGGAFGCKSHGLWYLRGFISNVLASRDGSCNWIMVFTDIEHYLDWIHAAYVRAE